MPVQTSGGGREPDAVEILANLAAPRVDVMRRYVPARLRPQNRRAIATTAGFAVMLVGVLGVAHAGSPSSPESTSSVLIGDGAPRSGCTALLAAVPPDDVPVIGPLVAAYDHAARTVDGRCVDVRIVPKGSGDAADALARGWRESVDGPAPQVWLPGDSAWLSLVRTRATGGTASIVAASNPTYAQTPLVIAMPRPMATALGWPKKEIGFSDLVAIGSDPRGWASVGHPEWGPLRLGKTNPLVSTSGLQALIAAYFAATGVSADLTAANVSDPRVVAFVKGVESATVHYGDTSDAFLQGLRRADDSGASLSYVSAVALEEREVLAYNRGDPIGTSVRHAPPRVPLAAVYPKEGTLVSDNPFAVLNAPWVSSDQRDAANDLLAFLLSPAQQHRLQDAGYRDAQGRPGTAITTASGLLADHPRAVVSTPPASVLDKVQRSWYLVRKPARVLVIIDRSGSMDATVGSTGMSKLDLVKAAMLTALDQVGDQDEVGIWSFSDTHDQLAPVGPVGVQRAALKSAVGGLSAGGGTLLYDTVRDGLDLMASTADPAHISAVVVLTDGQDNGSSGSLDDLLQAERTQPAGSTVRVFTIAYGDDADSSVLRQIAEASQASAYDASNPALIQQVFNAVLSNF